MMTHVTWDGLVLEEMAPGFTFDQVQPLTEPRLLVKDEIKTIQI